MGGFRAPRTGGGGTKGGGASGRRGGALVTTRRHVEVDVIQSDARRSRKRNGWKPDAQPKVITLCEQVKGLAEADMEANGDCMKCAFPQRKDYKHTCSRAYGRGRIARPVKPSERGSRAGTMLTIGFNGEHLCTARSARDQHSACTHLTASDRLWVSLAGVW